MTVSKSNDSLVFNTRTLRLIIGALAFAFPSTVIALTGGKITTFIVETISLVFFGIAWMTASQLEYLNQILAWWRSKCRETSTPLQPEAPEPEAA
jgi:hypothetical protein